MNENYDEYFGFVESEVKDMLAFYHREKQMETMKEWYDGYLFGTSEVYNPSVATSRILHVCYRIQNQAKHMVI